MNLVFVKFVLFVFVFKLSDIMWCEHLRFLLYMLGAEGVHSMFLRKKNLKFFCSSFEKNVLLRMCIQQQMRMFSMSH